MKKAYITLKEKELFALIPAKACNYCHEFSSNIIKDERGFYILESIFSTQYMQQHISEILHRKLIFE